jgi:hypothetical protein
MATLAAARRRRPRGRAFWSTRELGTYAIEGSQHGSLGAGLVHAAATLGLLGATTLTITLARLRHPASTRHVAQRCD